MNTYEKHVLQEFRDWQEERRGYIEELANNAVLSVFSYTTSYVPPAICGTIAETVESALRKCFSGSLYTTSKAQIAQQANKIFGGDTHTIHDLKRLELEQLDLLASSYCTSSEVMALLEGAGMGLGGLLFMAADIPALIMINIRALIQLSYIYGIDASHPDEREFILNIMALAASDPKERAEILAHLDTIARANGQKRLLVRQIQDQLVGEAMNHVVHVAHKIAVRLTHAKLLQVVPIIGSALGAGSNFLYTKEMMHFGTMVLRKRWLTQKYNLPADNVVSFTKSAPPEPLLTSWVMLPGSDESDDELEEDFRNDAEMKISPNNRNRLM